LLVVGGIIGSGIFFTPAETARALPSAGLVFLVKQRGYSLLESGLLSALSRPVSAATGS